MIVQVEGRGRIIIITSLFCFLYLLKVKQEVSFVVEHLQICNILVVVWEIEWQTSGNV